MRPYLRRQVGRFLTHDSILGEEIQIRRERSLGLRFPARHESTFGVGRGFLRGFRFIVAFISVVFFVVFFVIIDDVVLPRRRPDAGR